MDTPLLPRRVPEAPVVGQKAAFTRTFTGADIVLFIGVTWDVNPYHTDDAYVSAARFKRRIVPGQLTAGLLTHIGGLWAFLATEMHFQFLAPVYIDDTIAAETEVAEFERGLSLRTPAACRAGSSRCGAWWTGGDAAGRGPREVGGCFDFRCRALV